MTSKPDSGRRTLIIAICVTSVLVVALGGFIAYKLLTGDNAVAQSTTASDAPADSTAKATADADVLASQGYVDDQPTDPAPEATGKGGASEARLIGFIDGVKKVQFGFEAGFGYTYHFDRSGQLTAVDYFDHGNEGTLTMLSGKGIKFDGEDMDFDDDDESPKVEAFHNVIEYREQADRTDVYMSVNGQPAEKIGTYYVDAQGRITRVKNSTHTYLFKYDAEGRAFTQDGEEMYPPLIIFFSEAPTLPKKHTVREKDAKGRPTQVDAYQDMQHYTITYWE